MSFTTRNISGTKPPRRFPWQKMASTLFFFGPPLIRWFAHHRQVHAEQKAQDTRIHWLKRIFLIVLAIFLSFAVLAGVATALISFNVVDVRGLVGAVGTELPTDENGFTNILLLGQGDAAHQGADLTDTMIIASIDARHTKTVAMISLPRDLYLTKTNKMGIGRINGLYRNYKSQLKREGMEDTPASQASMEELKSEVSNITGVELHRVVKVDFIGFKDAVDALGGIDITVPETIIDTTYPGPNYSYQTFTMYEGPQHLDGETALKYARSRHTTSDFSRSARQQQIISAIVERAKDKGILSSPSTITSLYQAIQKNLETTMTLREMISLASVGMDLDRDGLISVQINSTSGVGNGASAAGGFVYTPPRENFQGAFVLLPVPVTGLETWESMRTFVDLILKNRAFYTQKPMVDVLNAGARSGLGRALGGELLRNGIELNELRNADIPDQETSSIIAQTASGALYAPFLSEILHIPVLMTEQVPPELDPVELGDITILVGKDYEYQPLARLRKPTAPSSSMTDESAEP